MMALKAETPAECVELAEKGCINDKLWLGPKVIKEFSEQEAELFAEFLKSCTSHDSMIFENVAFAGEGWCAILQLSYRRH